MQTALYIHQPLDENLHAAHTQLIVFVTPQENKSFNGNLSCAENSVCIQLLFLANNIFSTTQVK